MRVARPFFKSMIAADTFADAAAVSSLGGQLVPLDTLLSEADFVVVCCLLNGSTRHLISDAPCARMKPTAYFVNVGRGPITDEAALARALQAKRIAGATRCHRGSNRSPTTARCSAWITSSSRRMRCAGRMNASTTSRRQHFNRSSMSASASGRRASSILRSSCQRRRKPDTLCKHPRSASRCLPSLCRAYL